MKKSFLSIIILTAFKYALSNPIVFPVVFISEFTFDYNNKWMLELSLGTGVHFQSQNFDSICVYSSGGCSKIKLGEINEGTELFVVTSENLSVPLNINRDGDKIKIRSFPVKNSNMYRVDSLTFGNYPGSLIDKIKPGYSIIRIGTTPAIFCKNRYPSIGEYNNQNTGYFGMLRGYLFDKNHRIITKGIFELDDQIKFDPNGQFYTKVFSRRLKSSQLTQFKLSSVQIESIDIDLEPDSACQKNIYLLSDYYVCIKKDVEPEHELQLVNYPNPFNLSTNFFVKVPQEFKAKDGFINIYTVNGQLVNTIEITDKSIYQWTGKDNRGNNLASGIYYYQLVINRIILKNGSMILLK